jgi:RNA polymerase sigma-70 factor (ECF subfamily)
LNAGDRRRQIEDLCHAALDRDPAARAAFVATACGSDEDLRSEVEALIADAVTAEGFLARPPEALAEQALGEGSNTPTVGPALKYGASPRAEAASPGLIPKTEERRWARVFVAGRDVLHRTLLRRFHQFPLLDARQEHALRAHLRAQVADRVSTEIGGPALRTGAKGPTLVNGGRQAVTERDKSVVDEERRTYLAGLRHLHSNERELVVARLELGYSYEQIALMTGQWNRDIVKHAVRRAVAKLAAEMEHV